MPEMNRSSDRGAKSRRRRQGTAAGEIRDNRELLSMTRRCEVFRNDVEHTGIEEAYPAPPRPGTPERAELERRVGELYAQGMAQLRISAELGLEQSLVGRIISTNGFKKGSKP